MPTETDIKNFHACRKAPNVRISTSRFFVRVYTPDVGDNIKVKRDDLLAALGVDPGPSDNLRAACTEFSRWYKRGGGQRDVLEALHAALVAANLVDPPDDPERYRPTCLPDGFMTVAYAMAKTGRDLSKATLEGAKMARLATSKDIPHIKVPASRAEEPTVNWVYAYPTGVLMTFLARHD